MTNIITLNCLVLGEDPKDNVFDVDIDTGKSVNKLKKAIKGEKSPEFDTFATDKLTLWKVDIPLDAENDKLTTLKENIPIGIDVENDLDGTKLQAAYPISFYFPDQPAAIRVHVIVKPPTLVSTAFENLSTTRSTSVIANRIKNHRNFRYLDSDLSFLEVLTNTETRQVRKIYDKISRPNSAWTKEIEEVQPWVQSMCKELAKFFGLTVNWDYRRGGQYGEIYADHYLTHTEWSHFCTVERPSIDFTKCWAFEDKPSWQPTHLSSALVQCHGYSAKFFDNDLNRSSKYVSIITDARNYRLWYAHCGQEMEGGLTQDYDWSRDTVEILGRVFKTFKKANLYRANASPGDFGNLGASKDISAMNPATRPPDFFLDPRVRDKILYDMVVKWAKKLTPSRLPIVTTNIGDIEARRLLGTGSDTVVFEGLTTDNVQVAIKYSFHHDPLRREAETLKKLNEVKSIPRLLHEDFDGVIPYIVTSMVGRKVTKIDAPIACNIIIGILEVLKGLHDHRYIHNDINPGNIVKVGDKFRLIDFGLAVPRCDKRDAAPIDWPMGHIIYASHNRGKYLGAGDDLEALCYTVAFMHNQDKEYWRAAAQDPFKALHEKAEISNILSLFDSLPHVFQEFFRYVYDLDIAAIPDYEYWHIQFTSTASDLSSLPKKRLPETPLGSSEGKPSQRSRCVSTHELLQSTKIE